MLTVHGDWLLTPERAAVHRPSATAVVADLHLGYDQARRRGGEAVPCFDLGRELDPLRRLFARCDLARLVIAGDLFERAWDDALVAKLLGWLGGFRVETLFVPGNHDRGVPTTGALPVFPGGVDVGGWRVVHGDGELPGGRLVCGHFHPWLRRGPLSAACYLVGNECLVLPAFSCDAAGVNVLGQRRWRRHRCCAIAGDEVLDLGDVGVLQRRKAIW